MSLWEHLKQLCIEFAFACRVFAQAVNRALFDIDGRIVRSTIRRGQNYARLYAKQRMFTQLGPHAAVAINVRDGAWIAADTHQEAEAEFRKRYGNVPIYIHDVSPRWA